ncbi:ABC transporter permease [Streptomyces sp. ISL-94]|uniref:ABC transporter permease n=1 Tax=Streptomyces sp. ISL-94 TaxID=2819190 RepID=UPI001BE7809C|nr:FtsX-like permease family protein [Streptomyces sp. ISL-94]MBT2478063.1 ABC transporter permease [Streptomyces sp. ISL-94]
MSTLRAWARDLSTGARFAFGGGRQGWTRTLLTGIGVGLGVALLLITTALPSALAARYERGDARSTTTSPTVEQPGPDTLLIYGANQTYRDTDIEGALLQAEGPDAPLPPGLTKIPGLGEMAVSPALRQLLESSDGKLLRDRLDGRISEVIGDTGLIGPGELLFYAGTDRLGKSGPQDYRVQRITGFSHAGEREQLDPVLTLLVVLTFVALLLPVAVFIAAAVRFGGERRDRRLAALRLVGADALMVRRIAAGEALAGSLVGLVLGVGFFAVGRGLVGSFTLQERSVFPADLDPSVWLAALVALVVPAAAVAVTLFAMRGVVVEPLGVVRTVTPRRRRIWWRLLLPLAGLGLLAPMTGRGNSQDDFNRTQVSAGVVLLLVGITALLPWLLEQLVGRTSGGGPVSWQLAVRRLQLDRGAATRLVNGIAVAVAGAIALQMLFAAVEADYTEATGQDPSRAALSVLLPRDGEDRADALAAKISAARGVARAVPLTALYSTRLADAGSRVAITAGTCEALREVAVLDACKDGDAFVLTGTEDKDSGIYGSPAKPGETLSVSPATGPEKDEKTFEWTLPATALTVASRVDPTGSLRDGILVTPSIAPKAVGDAGNTQVFVQLDESVPDALELARTATVKADRLSRVMTLKSTTQDAGYAAIRTGLFFGATAVLILIGASLLVSQLEQLRERRKLLSSLVAFGTKRSTLCLSVLWQTALPITLGLALAAAVGVGLGAVLMRMAGRAVRIDWAPVTAMTGVGAGLVAAMTVLSLPPLLRLMRPDGLRTE